MTEQNTNLAVESLEDNPEKWEEARQALAEVEARHGEVNEANIEGTQRAVEQDIAKELFDAAPGGSYNTISQGAQIKHMTETRNRQVENWLNKNCSTADRALMLAMQNLRDAYVRLIAELTPEEFKEHAVQKFFDADAIGLSWKAKGIQLNAVQFSFNPTTGYPVIKKQTPIFGRGIAIKNPNVDKLLRELGVNLSLQQPDVEKVKGKPSSILNEVIFSVGQHIELYMTPASTIVKFKSAPSQQLALRPLDVTHNFEAMGFNAMLKVMADRKLVAMTRKDWYNWSNKSAENDDAKPSIDVTTNPLYAKGVEPDAGPVAVNAGEPLPW